MNLRDSKKWHASKNIARNRLGPKALGGTSQTRQTAGPGGRVLGYRHWPAFQQSYGHTAGFGWQYFAAGFG
ncbi:MAG: hypothetical protein JEZ00_11860 [Anaerolineaceae bacterium]|nr:hypothetical protein [Anaerolineaceae bacterium]